MNHALDRSISGVGIDWRSGKHKGIYLVGKARSDHGRNPAALAKADQIDAAAKVINRNDDFGKIVIDLKVFHVVGCRLPIGQRDMADAIGQQRLYEALTFVVVGDHGRVPSMRRVHKSRHSLRLAVIAQLHGPQIKPHRIRRRQAGTQVVVNLDLFLSEFEVFGVEFRALLHQGCGHRHRPECRDARERKFRGFAGGFFGMIVPLTSTCRKGWDSRSDGRLFAVRNIRTAHAAMRPSNRRRCLAWFAAL